MELYRAQTLAAELIELIKPYCLRIEVAGSVRRECNEVNDIDIVLIQHPYRLEQFMQSQAAKDAQIEVKNNWNKDLKWGPKHKQIRFKGVKVELWLADKLNWGLQLMIRTGSADFTPKMLAQWKTVSYGGCSDKGMLRTPDGRKVPVYEETNFFELCEIDWVDPKHRN